MAETNKTEQLNKLFKEWQKRVPENNVWDGINNEELYNKANSKILFISKEPNNPKRQKGDFREWWKNDIKYAFSLRIAEWSHGILNNFPEFDKIKNDKDSLHKALLSVAFMNLKKVGGGGSANYDQIMYHVKKSYDLIHRQIEIINPDIIVLGISWKEVRTEIFPDLQWKNSGYDIDIGKYKKSKIIDFYHPSSRNAPAAAYSLLQNIIRSRAFIEL